MSNIVLAWPNHSDDATLTSSATWVSTLPLTELQTRIFSDVAQTANLSPTITVTWSDYRSIGTVALAAHNLSATATVRIRIYSDASKTTLLEDSGTNPAWPRVFDSLSLPWESSNFWSGQPLQSDIAKFTPLYVWHSTRNYFAKCVQIDIVDSSNPASYVEIGRLFCATRFQPRINPNYGKLDIQYVASTDVTESQDENTTEYFRVRKPKRMVYIGLDWLDKTEAIMKILDAQRTQGIDKEILYAETAKYDAYSMATTFIGRLTSLDKLSLPNINLYSGSINIKEIL